MNAVVQMSKRKGLDKSSDRGGWKRRPGGESRQEPGDFTGQYFGWKEKALVFVHQVITCGDF